MRIIAGTHRSRVLLAPKDDSVTRPITDRVKQSLFDRLWAMGLITADDPEHGGNVVDLFAGTGSLGLEALSRGSHHCVFVEIDRSARMLLDRNIAALELTDRATVLGVDALASGWMSLIAGSHTPVRVVFCDPPYQLLRDPVSAGRVAELMAALAAPGCTPGCAPGTASGVASRFSPGVAPGLAPGVAAPGFMEPGGTLVLRTDDRAQAPVVTGWQGPTSHPYGSMVLHFYGKG